MGNVRQLEYFQIEPEATWGTDPDTGSAPQVGIAPDEYTVDVENEALQQDKFTGEHDDVYIDIVGQTLSGSMSMQVWPEITTLLLQLAGIPREPASAMKSYSIQCYDRALNQYLVHTGLKADNVEISASGSAPKLIFNYDLIGKAEAICSSFVKPTLPSEASFEFTDGEFTINNSVEANVTDFSISIANNLAPSEPKDDNRNIKWLDEGRRQIEVSFTIRADSTAGDYRSLVRNRTRAVGFVASFDYPGTGSPFDNMTITLPALVLQSAVPTGGVGDQRTIACTAVAKMSAGSAAIVITTT